MLASAPPAHQTNYVPGLRQAGRELRTPQLGWQPGRLLSLLACRYQPGSALPVDLRYPDGSSFGGRSSCGRRSCCCLEGEQGALGVGSGEVAAYSAVRAHDAVAWHDDGQRVSRTCRSHRSAGPGVAGQPCHGGVAGGVSVADLGQAVQHGAAEACRQAPVQRREPTGLSRVRYATSRMPSACATAASRAWSAPRCSGAAWRT
jgi:hypothetical protein